MKPNNVEDLPWYIWYDYGCGTPKGGGLWGLSPPPKKKKNFIKLHVIIANIV